MSVDVLRVLRLIVVSAALSPAAAAQAADVTFNKNIAPLVWERCGACHRPGQPAPFGLIEYKDVRTRARQILAAVRSNTMPPWLPEPGYGSFVNERRLSKDERELLEEWVRQGAREGNPGDLPPRPRWIEGWQLGAPDLVLTLPEPYMLKPGQQDVFRNFVLPVPLSSGRYVRGIEVNPGNPRSVHHASIAVDATRASRLLDEADPEPGFAGGMFSEAAQAPESRALGWTPGITPSFEPPDMAWRLEEGTDLVLQLHMIPPRAGEPEAVRPSVGFFFTAAPPTRKPLDFKLASKAIDIPAGVRDYTIDDRYELPVDVEVLSVYPHAHYLATDMRAFATLPDGRVEWLIWIRNWNFHWQDQYRFATPVFLPRGTVVTMRYTYDNSAGNRRNPQRPPKRVVYGGQSSDEMGDLWLRLLPKDPADAATLARSYRDNERRRDIALAEQRIVTEGRDPRWRNLLGARLLEAGRIDEAIVHLEEAVRLAPHQAEGHNNLGHALQLQGRVAEAVPHFRQAVQLAPASDLVHLNLGNALDAAGEIDEAIHHFREAIALNPGAAEAHNNLGVVLGSQGMLDEAAAHFRRALEIRPDYADPQNNLELVIELQKAPAPPR